MDKHPRITPGSVVASMPDLLLAVAYLLLFVRIDWAPIPPERLFIIMYLEFFLIGATFAWVGSLFHMGRLASKITTVLGSSLFIAFFVLLLSLGSRDWWPFTTFWLLTLKRIIALWVNQKPTDEVQQANARSLAAGVIFWLLSVVIGLLIHGAASLFQIEVEILLIAGFPYFLAIGISGLYNHVWVGRVKIKE